MKWKYIDFEKKPELSPDLEWMLQSGQVSRQFLLETLVEHYYRPVYQLAVSLTNDGTAAQNIASDIFSFLSNNRHKYRGQIGVNLWVYQNAYRICLRALRGERFWRSVEWWISSPGQFTNPLVSEPSSEYDRHVWKQIDELDDSTRFPILLHYANDWEIPLISQVTGLRESEVEERIRTGIPEIYAQPSPSKKDIESRLRSSLHSRWLIPDLSENPQVLNRVNKVTTKRLNLQGSAATFKELMLVGLAILLVLLAIWGGNRYLLGEELLPISIGSAERTAQPPVSSPESPVQQSEATSTAGKEGPQASEASRASQSTITPTPEGVFYTVIQGESLESIAIHLGVPESELRQFNRLPGRADVRVGQNLVIPGSLPTSRPLRATPVAPASHSSYLPAPKTSEDVFNLLNPDESQYNTLWFSADIYTRIPPNLAAAAKISQIQVWLSPRQFLLLGGKLGEEPHEVSIGMRGRLYLARPGQGQLWFERVSSRFADPFDDPALLQGLYMLFGEIGDLARSEFVVLGDSLVAGRQAWVVSQLSARGEHIGLLYLDKETGFILRYRSLAEPEFDRETGAYLPDEVVIRDVNYNVDFPQELFDISLPWRGGYAADHTGEPGYPDLMKLEHSFSSMKSGDRSPDATEHLDPASATLSFRFPIDMDKNISMAKTEIYANGFSLGRTNMGIPWNVTCQRSPDGEVIVYRRMTSDKDDLITESNGPYYLVLQDPLEIRKIMPGAERIAGDFAISPDSRSVAVWACEGNGSPCAVYLHDIKNHHWQRLIDIPNGAADFVWSPEGDQLAMRTAGDTLLVVSARDGEVLYTGDYADLNQAPLENTPVGEWGLAFPPPASGLEACVNPP